MDENIIGLDVIQGVTSNGFAYAIKRSQIDNYDLFEAISESEENPSAFPKVMKLLLGPEQTNKLKEHCRKEDGTIPIKPMMDVLTEIMNGQQPVKN